MRAENVKNTNINILGRKLKEDFMQLLHALKTPSS
jgi:hypothetical protein